MENKVSIPIQILENAMGFAMKVRPKVGGFPYLAEALRTAGVINNIWSLPACQSIYVMREGNVVSQGTPLVTGMADIPKFDRDSLIKALRIDQAGESTFPEFLKSSWEAGVIGYEVTFEKRMVTYYGSNGESYVESYPSVDLPTLSNTIY